jgi:hypothetical protein
MRPLRIRYTALMACLLMLSVGNVVAVEGQDTEPPHVMLAGLTIDTSDQAITSGKVEAALALAADLSARFHYISTYQRDSILMASGKGQGGLTAIDAARIVEARYLAFVRVQRLHHLVRSEVVLHDAWGIRPERRGAGFASLRLHHVDESVLADPAVLASLQRALALAFADSTMFAMADSGLRARPGDLAAVGGIEFTNDPTMESWNLFKEKVAVSYDIVQNIIHGLADSERVTLLDVETRDTLYAMFGLHLTENYNQVSAIEVSHLRKSEVTHLITGALQRSSGGAVLRLAWNRIEPEDRFTSLSTVSETITSDSKEELRKAVARAIARLIRD